MPLRYCIAHLIVHNLTPMTPDVVRKSSEIYNRGEALANVGYSIVQREQTTPNSRVQTQDCFLTLVVKRSRAPHMRDIREGRD